jgi:ubiquinone/menaquinone biosynthesis C-methylase UbiE
MDEKSVIVDAFSEMAPRYEQVVDSELNRFWGWSYASFVKHMLASTPIQSKDIILDIATGTGYIPYQLEQAGHPSRQIHGLDITLSMLEHARLRLDGADGRSRHNLVCASAMEMPYACAGFTQVLCGLATHHMDVRQLLLECRRVLRNGGTLTIADVGGAKIFRFPGVKLFVRIVLLIYFGLVENRARAWAEAGAVSHVLSQEDWYKLLVFCGFRNITIKKLKSKYFWVPSPLLIKAEK